MRAHRQASFTDAEEEEENDKTVHVVPELARRPPEEKDVRLLSSHRVTDGRRGRSGQHLPGSV